MQKCSLNLILNIFLWYIIGIRNYEIFHLISDFLFILNISFFHWEVIEIVPTPKDEFLLKVEKGIGRKY